MRRIVALAATVVLMSAAFTPAVLAQYEDHPAVGSWVLDTAPENPQNPPEMLTFNAEGTYRNWTVNGTGVGAWEPSGERGFAGTALYPFVDEGAGLSGLVKARIVGEVAEDGQTMSGTYTVEFPTEPVGVFPPPGEYGPAAWIATRILVEPQGETVGPYPLPPAPAE